MTENMKHENEKICNCCEFINDADRDITCANCWAYI